MRNYLIQMHALFIECWVAISLRFSEGQNDRGDSFVKTSSLIYILSWELHTIGVAKNVIQTHFPADKALT